MKHNIETIKSNGVTYETGYLTLEELIEHFGYTLECGVAYQHEKGNKKIDRNPKTIKSLIKNLNNAVSNAARDGVGNKEYRLKWSDDWDCDPMDEQGICF